MSVSCNWARRPLTGAFDVGREVIRRFRQGMHALLHITDQVAEPAQHHVEITCQLGHFICPLQLNLEAQVVILANAVDCIIHLRNGAVDAAAQ